ncbi:hypothetical protein Tco_1157155 [Tanacetum coccineum]
MSADSAVTYTSVHSEARSWSNPILRIITRRRLARQLLEQAPHSLEVWTPPLLPIPLPAPSTSRRADIPKADTPPRKRLLLTAPRPGCEVGESSAAAAARQPGPTMARRVDCSSVDTVETRVRDTERRMMAALEVVNLRVSYQVDVRSRESSEFYSRHHDAQKDRAAMRAEIEAYSRALEAWVTMLETQARHYEWQRQDADDRATRHIMRIQEARARDDTLEDTASRRYRSFVLISYPDSIEEEMLCMQWLKQKQVKLGMATTAMALRGSSDSLDGLRKWSLCLALAIAQHLVKSNLQLALYKTMLLHGGMPMLRPLL